MKTIQTILFILFSLALTTTEARVGGGSGADRRGGKLKRRKLLQHRKLQWAADEYAIPDQYIIVFEDNDTEEEVKGLIKTWLTRALTGSKVLYRFQDALKAVVIKRLSVNILSLILSDTRIKYVEEVSKIRDTQPLRIECHMSDTVHAHFNRMQWWLKQRLRPMRPGDWTG
jgi:hypothetical protein